MTAVAAIAVLGPLTLLLGGLLEAAARGFRPTGERLVDAIDAVLPQTQCERCGYPGCRPYAAAIESGVAINRCPPGGVTTIAALAELLDRDVVALDPDLQPINPDAVALIDEARCIGCALCLPPCPVDAIVGAAGYMHTVIARHCTGCELCVPACPVDCISIVAPAASAAAVLASAGAGVRRADDSRRRYEVHTQRIAAEARAAEERRRQRQDRLSARSSWDEA